MIKGEPIDVDRKYGLDGQYIYFDPAVPDIRPGDVIVQDDAELICIEKGVFMIWDLNFKQFVTGDKLLKTWSRLSSS